MSGEELLSLSMQFGDEGNDKEVDYSRIAEIKDGWGHFLDEIEMACKYARNEFSQDDESVQTSDK